MPPKKYRRNNAPLIRRPARKSKVPVPDPDPQETHNPEVTATSVVELCETLISGSVIEDNVRVSSETVSRPAGNPVELKQETLGVELKKETVIEKESVNIGDEERVAETETNNVVKKKKTKIVKRTVKRKVLKKINHVQGKVLHQDSVNEGMISGNAIGNVKSVSNECVDMDVKNPNLKPVEIGDCTNNVVMKTENCVYSDVFGKSVNGCDSNPTCIVWSEVDKCSVVGGKPNELEAFEVVKHRVNVENILDLKSGDYKQEEGFENNLELKTKDCNQEVGSENNQEYKSEDSKQEEGVNNKDECSEYSEMKAETSVETSVADTVLSGEMGALERRRRRKTEIFVGGLDKHTREEDIRKIFEVAGEVKDVTLVNSSKTKNRAFAFVRYTLAADAKKALIKYRKVEICGSLCGTSPVEGNDTLFLGNIDKRWKSDDVTKLLQGIGIEKIDHVTVISDPKNIELNRGFAFLELESIKDAQNAYKKLQKAVFGKHLHIKVAWAEPLIEPDENELSKVKSVYAEYLPSSWDEEKVRDCFKRFGDIENVALASDMPSSRRNDFAFVNYATREAALACVEAFSHEQTNDEGSKVKVKVSLAKPIPKIQQIKHPRTPTTKKSAEKQKGTPLVRNLQGSGITRNLTSINYNTRIEDHRSSMTSELVQLLREQATMRPTKSNLNTGFVNREHPCRLSGRKRPFPVHGDDLRFSFPSGHPRARVERSHAITNPSVPIRSVGMMSLPHHQQGASYVSGPVYGMERRPTYIQPRERAPYYGNIGAYQRY